MGFPIFTMYWRRTLRKPGSVYLWMLLPFVFMAIYQLTFGGESSGIAKVAIAVVDRDSTFVSNFVTGALNQGELSDFVEAKPVAGIDGAAQLFRDGKASAALVIPDGFSRQLLAGDDVQLQLLTNPREYIAPEIAEGVIGALVAMGNGVVGVFSEPLRTLGGFIDGDSIPSADRVADLARTFYQLGDETPNVAAVTSVNVTVAEEPAQESVVDRYGLASLFFPGLIMFALLSVSLHIETRLLHDRLNRVNERMTMAPVHPMAFVLQQRLYSASFIYIVAVVSAVLGAIVWRIPAEGVVTANLICVAMVLFISGINGAIFSLSNSLRAVSAISSVVMMTLLILGGGFFPVESTPGGFQRISAMIPTGMANLGLTRAVTGRDPEISIPLLFVYCLAFFAASIVLSRRRVA